MSKYIVCYTLKTGGDFHDSWAVHEDMGKAMKEYKDLCADPDVYTASICRVVKSTDYFGEETDGQRAADTGASASAA